MIDNLGPDERLESALAARIDPWLEHMRWRPDFARWRERRLFQERYQADHLASVQALAGDVRGKEVLDLGAGMGGFSVALARQGARLWALEFNADYCQIVRLRARRYGLDLPVARAAGESLPYAAASFDLVCSWDVLEHVQDPQAVLREVARVLRPGGAALVSAINRYAFRDPHYHLPGLNWLPRPWAEAWIRRAARGKEGSRFADRQRLSEMHYFRWGEFVRAAAAAGLRAEDWQERQLQLLAGALPARRPARRALRRLLRLLGLERPAYRAARACFLPYFEVALWRSA